MTSEAINAAAEAATVFLHRVTELQIANATADYGSPKLSGALRRASMELTRALAEMRRPG